MNKKFLMMILCGLPITTNAYAVDEVDFGLGDETFIQNVTAVGNSIVEEKAASLESKVSAKVDEVNAEAQDAVVKVNEKVEEIKATVDAAENVSDEVSEKAADAVADVENKIANVAVKADEAEVIIESPKADLEGVANNDNIEEVAEKVAATGVIVEDKVEENAEIEQPVSAENGIIQNKGVLEVIKEPVSEAQEPVTSDGSEIEQDLSYYVQKLNLSVEQLDLAKYISDDSRLKQEQLLKSISLLRKQARELEAKSLEDFEAILTDEQREQFLKLREVYEKKHPREVLDLDNLSEVMPKAGE